MIPVGCKCHAGLAAGHWAAQDGAVLIKGCQLDSVSLSLDFQGMFRALGVCGFLLYIGSFGALQLRLIDGNGALYTLLNIAAAALVLISLVYDFNLASALIQVSWVGIGVVGLALRMISQRR